MKPISKSGLRTPVRRPRSLLLALTLSLITLSTVRGQVPYPQPAAPSDTVFPIGALSWGMPDSNIQAHLSHFGMNMLWGQLPGTEGANDTGALGFFLPTGTYGIGYNPLFAEADFHLASNESGASAWDLASTLTDSANSKFWGLTTGGINADLFKTHIPNSEWYIIGSQDLGPDLSPAHPGYYLWGLDSDMYTGGQIVQVEKLIGTNTDSTFGSSFPGMRDSLFYIDFVYRLDSITYAGFTDTAYMLEVNVKWRSGHPLNTSQIKYSVNDGTTWRPGSQLIVDPVTSDYEIPISFADYKNFVGQTWNPMYDSLAHLTENPNLIIFPNARLSPPIYTPEPYAILRIEVSSDTEVLQENPVCPITVNLKGSTDPRGIYVRGVRIRNDWADDLYRGYFDNTSTAPDGNNLHQIQPAHFPTGGLKAEFNLIEDRSGAGWQTALYFIVGNECNWQSWRAFGYLNERLRAYSMLHGGVQKNFNTIVTFGQNLEFWRPIYEDQSKTNAPPVLQNENIAARSGVW